MPSGLRVYAVGDIHGRADLLVPLQERIRADAAAAPSLETRVVYLGDYVDRGPASRDVLQILIDSGAASPRATHLMGNHEAMMLRFLDDSSVGPDWFAYGGLATLMSYGVQIRGDVDAAERLTVLQRELAEALPPSHREFLSRLPTHVGFGDYFFAHAGVRPRVPLEQQADADLIWIREEFLGSREFHGKIVVHGHSFKTEPEFLANRIGIDTGAYATGRLTCLVLEGRDMRLL